MDRIQKHSLFWIIILLGWGCFSGCQSMSGAVKETGQQERPHTIAVWDLDNLNPAELEGLQLGELLAGKVIEVLEESGQWVVVERKDLILALEEQNLGSSALVSEETRLQIGRLLGANAMVFGTYMKFLKDLQINLRVVDVETGQVMKAGQQRAPFSTVGNALKMTRQAALKLLKS
jgi:hypothetical protein